MAYHEDYLDSEHLAHLKTYAYRAQDLSWVGNTILQPWWRFAASFLPRWMAPNLVTLIGFAFIVVNVLSIMWFLPDLVGPAPSWLYMSFAFGLFAYQTMDNCDGKQARATATSSPLGELFDHVIDSLNCPLGGLVITATTGVGHSWRGVFFVMVSMWPMALSSWEEYHTGELFLGVINGPDDGLLLAMGVMLLSGFFGPALWQRPVSEVLPWFVSALLPAQLHLVDLFIAVTVFALVAVHAPTCFQHVYAVCGRRGRRAALLQLLPMSFFTLSALTWVLSPFSVVLAEQHFVEFSLSLCFLFGRQSTHVILSHLTKGGYPLDIDSAAPLALGALLVNLPYAGVHVLTPALERALLHLTLVYATARFAVSAKAIIDAFCRTLGIHCLRIPGP